MPSSIFLLPVFLLLLLLLIPIDLEGLAGMGKKPEIRLIWLYGLIRKDILPDIWPEKEPSDKILASQKMNFEEPPAEKSQDKIHSWSGREILSIIQTEGLMGNLKQLLKDLVHAIRIRDLHAHLRIGLEDPADTGQAAGCIWSAVGYLQSFCPLDIKIDPSFCQEMMEGEGQGAIRIWPALVMLSMLRFSFSRPTLRAAGKIIRIAISEK